MKSNSLESKFQLSTLVIIGTTLISLLLIPYTTNEMWSDDFYNSQLWDMIHRFHASIWKFSFDIFYSWIHGLGRIYLGFFPINGLFYVLHGNVLLIRISQIFFLLMNVACIVYLLRLVNMHWKTIGIFVLLLFSLFRISTYHDPIATFAILMQMMGILTTISLILLVKWRKSGQIAYLFASTFIYTISLLCYELNIIFLPIAIYIILTAAAPKPLRNILIFVIPFTLFLVLCLLLRHHRVEFYAGNNIGSIKSIPITYLKQLIGGLPGAYYLLNARHFITFPGLFSAHTSIIVAWGIAFLTFLYYRILLNAPKDNQTKFRAPRSILTTALAFVILPPFMVSISAKYQNELAWGFCYIPVYYQYIGLALILALLIQQFIENTKHSNFFSILFSFILAIYTATNWLVNINIATLLNGIYGEPVKSFTSAVKVGLLDRIKDGDIIESKVEFISGNHIYKLTKKNIYMPVDWIPTFYLKSKPRDGAVNYLLYRESNPNNLGTWKLVVKNETDHKN